MAEPAPLSAVQRRQVVQIVGEVDAVLADALASELELDPTVRLLFRGVETSRDQASADARETRTEVLAELRATRWQVVGVVVLALMIQAGMVGLSISMSGVGPLPDIEVQPSSPVDPLFGDDAAFIEPGPEEEP